MGWILFKRALRDLKAGWTRYIALSLLIIFSIFIVVSLMGAAVTIIDYTELRDRELCREDGEFSVFVPLRDEEEKKLTDKGISLEKMFFVDYDLNEDQVLRAFKVRENINRISIIDGSLPANDNEAVLERRYSEVNNINIGDKVTIGGKEFTISGIGAAPDYNTVIKKVSDTVVDSRYFGLIFMTSKAYEDLYASVDSVNSEEYYYAYLLNGAMTEDELKDYLEDIEFDVDDIDDPYFKEYWNKVAGKKDDILEGIDKLKDGAKDIAKGASELYDGTSEFNDGMGELKDSMPELKKGVKELDDGAAQLEKGVKAYTDGVSQVESGASSLSSGAKSLANGTKDLNSGAKQYGSGVDQYSESVNAMTQNEDPYVAGVAASMAGPVKDLANGYSQIKSGVAGVDSGAQQLSSGANQLYNGIKKLKDNNTALRNGATALHKGTTELKNGTKELADGVDKLYDGSGKIKDGAKELADGTKKYADGVKEFSDEANDLIDEVFDFKTSNLMLFMNHNDNPRIDSAADDVQINYSASIIFGILLVMLFAYVISVFIVHMIDQESSVIGALYSMGVKRRTLTLSYVAVPVIVTFVSGVIGTLIAVLTPAGIPAQMADSLGYFSMPEMDVEVTPFILIYGLVVPPVTALIVNVLVVRNRLKKTPLALLRNEQKVVRGKDIKIKGLKFISMFRLRQIMREMRAGITVILGLLMSLLVALMAVNTSVYCSKVKDYYISQTKYEYMYNYKYPTEEVPEGGYEAVAEGFKKEIYGYTFDVTLMGITEDNPFFDTGKLPDNDTDLVVSSAVANKYALKVGDVFTLTDDKGERLYAFRVCKIFDYSASLMVFMDIDRCRDMFGEDDDYFNVVFSDHKLDIENGRLYSVVSKEEIARSSGIYVEMMGPMVTTMTVASSVIFLVVMYLMVKMMIDRSSFNISLVKIFGFRNKEVRKMYLDGNFYIVAIGALISIPLCKMIMDYIYPRYLVSNVGVGINPTYPPYLYLAIFLVIIVLYLAINLVLTGRIRKIVPAEVLKNRE
ncbi:putative ABC transport system permease protein [Ruminococcaceae bacterium R-25]|nr:putative ABC transport system permease protein [Ruminococcaceae bacterium R-25]SUQ11575.1 putative ABC transport system permease protein [Oscillospiraceae bacterium]